MKWYAYFDALLGPLCRVGVSVERFRTYTGTNMTRLAFPGQVCATIPRGQ